MKAYLKVLAPITIATVVGCTLNQDSKTTVVSTPADNNPSTVHSGERLKDEVLSEITEPFTVNQGYLPPVDAVRVEEIINYFDYDYKVPDSQSKPFSIKTEVAQSPWSSDHVLLQVALKGYELIEEKRPAENLVFLLDVSGSMNSPHKLPLLKKSLIMLNKQLKSQL
jgi:hypothetical protein